MTVALPTLAPESTRDKRSVRANSSEASSPRVIGISAVTDLPRLAWSVAVIEFGNPQIRKAPDVSVLS